MRQPRTWTLIALLAAVALHVAACGDSTEVDPGTGAGAETTTTAPETGSDETTSSTAAPPAETTAPAPPGGPLEAGPVITHLEPGNDSGAMDALIAGPVVVDGDCLYLDADVERYPVIWPNGTAWDPATDSVVFTNGTSVAAGEQVTAGGGYVSEDFFDLDSLVGAEQAQRIRACVDNIYGEIAIVNNAADAHPATGSRYLITLDFEPGDPLHDDRGVCWTVTTADGTRDVVSSGFPVQASARVIGTLDTDGTTYVCPGVGAGGPGPVNIRFVTATDLGDSPEATVCVFDQPDRCVTTTAEWDPG